MIPHQEQRFGCFALAGPIPSAPARTSWEEWMRKALRLAAQAEAAGEVPVGALVLNQQGFVLGQGANAVIARHDPCAHAEILALRAAGQTLGNYRMQGCVLLVTLEPCAMCAAAAVHARVDGIIYGAYDKELGAISSRGELADLAFINHHPWHMGGVLGEECMQQLHAFFARKR